MNSVAMKTLRTLLVYVLYVVLLSRPGNSNLGYSGRPSLQNRLKDHEYSIYNMFSSKDEDNSGDRPKALTKEKEELYEAYNLLHTLAQDFHKPFDAPAVIVVGHQTSGKSALIEALMGFQFNQVGGGTKTRRPVALRMQYNPNCHEPLCFLTLENGKEEQRSLTDIQAYIELENKRLERDATRSFDSREINIRMEYKYCPNMIVIDTPGMIHPPKGRQLTPQQRAIQQAAREAEALVLSKIKCPDYIILCVEDTTDWKHATTRNIVMQADPQLTRSVLVTTKLDTKLPQFSEPEDLEEFLKAPLIHTLFSQMLGGPFYTSVPSGRVGNSRDFDTNEDFVSALRRAEKRDRSYTLSKLGAMKAKSVLQTVGVSKLRSFLEARIEDSYRRNVAKIVPVLQTELKVSQAKLAQIDEELQSLSIERLRDTANKYREKFAKELSNIIQGTIRANPEEFGETLEMEIMKGGSFLTEQDYSQAESYQRLIGHEIDNAQYKLLGGAQYYRTLKEFCVAVKHGVAPAITENEIANAAGMGETHNGVNFMRAACIIAMEKAAMSFEPMLDALSHRMDYIMKRLYDIVEKLTLEKRDYLQKSRLSSSSQQPFQTILKKIFEDFVDKTLSKTIDLCREDLHGLTGFITWDIDDKTGASNTLYNHLPTPYKMKEIYNFVMEKKKKKGGNGDSANRYVEGDSADELDDERLEGLKEEGDVDGKVDKVLEEWSKANELPTGSHSKKKSNEEKIRELTVSKLQHQDVHPSSEVELNDYYRVMQLTEEMLSGSSSSRTSALVTSLVQYIIHSWRNHFARSAATKFNCFFLLPFLNEFPAYLRDELDRIYEGGMSELFDISETRRSLQIRRSELVAECDANAKLQARFDHIASQLSKHYKDGDKGDGSGGDDGADGADGFGGDGSDGGFGDSSSNSDVVLDMKEMYEEGAGAEEAGVRRNVNPAAKKSVKNIAGGLGGTKRKRGVSRKSQ